VRKDYDVLVGTNRRTITPTGWVQEKQPQLAMKRKVPCAGIRRG
jgi:hypothetical protein